MIRYSDLVSYTKEHHISWHTDLFEVLRGFFEEYSPSPSPQASQILVSPYEEVELFMNAATRFKEPEDGEYSVQDLIKLFST